MGQQQSHSGSSTNNTSTTNPNPNPNHNAKANTPKSTNTTQTRNGNITPEMTREQYQQFQKFLQQNQGNVQPKSINTPTPTIKHTVNTKVATASTPISQLPNHRQPNTSHAQSLDTTHINSTQQNTFPTHSQATSSRPFFQEPTNTVTNQFSQLQQERIYSQPNSTYHPQPRMDMVLQQKGKLSNVKDQYQNVYQQRQFESNTQYYNTLQYHGQIDRQHNLFETSQKDMYQLKTNQANSMASTPTQPKSIPISNTQQSSPQLNQDTHSTTQYPKTSSNRGKNRLRQELRRFSEKYDSHAMLGIRPEADVKEIERAYRRQARKVHPDHGGSEEAFKLLTKAYLSILEAKRAERSNRMNYQEMKRESQDYLEEQGRSGPAPLGTGQGFNRDRFNQLFDETRLEEVVDQGYSDWIQENPSSENGSKINSDLISQKFSLNVFNSTFEQQRNAEAPVSEEDRMIKYSEPKAAPVSKLGFTELGEAKIADFGKTASIENDKSLSYTDYRQAMTRTHLLDQRDRQATRPEYRDIEELERARESISYTMDDSDRHHYEQWKNHEANLENMRQDRVKERDQLVGDRYQSVQRALLGSEHKTITANSHS